MKIFLVVYACEPNQGGEHEVGWKISNELVDSCDVTVVTRKSNKKLIEECNEKKIDFQYIENDIFLRFKPPGKFSYFYYMAWQFSVFLYLNKLVKKEDIVHYLTFGNIHLPHFLFLLKSKLVLGPMGGGSVIDPALMRYSSFKVRLKSIIYRLINWTVKVNPIYYFLFSRSSKIILRTEETLNVIPKYFHTKCAVFLETGIDVSKIKVLKKERKLRKIITTARIIESKNIDQVIEVFKKLVAMTDEPLELSIVGDGSMKPFLQEKYASVRNINFLGRVPHEQVEALLQESDLFISCSIKEGGSHSLFEAAMNNCPIACYDISGMKEFPCLDASIKIVPTHDIDKNINGLAEKIKSFFEEDKVNQVCEKAIADLKENYVWETLGQRYIKIYEKIEKGN